MESVRNSTLKKCLISKYYPKVLELRQNHKQNKTAYINCHYNGYNIYIFTQAG